MTLSLSLLIAGLIGALLRNRALRKTNRLLRSELAFTAYSRDSLHALANRQAKALGRVGSCSDGAVWRRIECATDKDVAAALVEATRS